MSVGSISTLGVGSGLELQSILDDLRKVDEKQRVQPLKDNITRLESQLEAFNVVQNKLLDMRGHLRTLSLESTFLGRTIHSSNENVITATVSDGAGIQSNSITVERVATRSSWQSTSGFAGRDTRLDLQPAAQHSTSGVADTASGIVLAEDASMTISHGGVEFTVTGGAGGWTMDQLISNINDHLDNDDGEGGKLVTAEAFQKDSPDGDWFLRIKTATAGGTGAEHEVKITDNDSALQFADPPLVFEYQFGPAGSATTVRLELEAKATIEQLVDAINSQNNPGVTASIVDTGIAGSPYRLALRANDTGENNRVTIIDNPYWGNLAFDQQQGADGPGSLNAQLSIDGIVYQRQNNSINDIFPGVVMNLENPGTTTLGVEGKTDSIRDLVVDLVEAYNTVVQEIAGKVRYDEESGQLGVLARTTVQGLRHELQGLMTSVINNNEPGAIKSLFELGMEFSPDGRISLNTGLLDQALAENSEGVRKFFLGDSQREIRGFADRIHERLGSIASYGGLLDTEKNTANSRIRDLETRIESETMRLDRRYAVLARQFIELDSYMNQMTNMSSYLQSQFDSLSQLTSGSKKK